MLWIGCSIRHEMYILLVDHALIVYTSDYFATRSDYRGSWFIEEFILSAEVYAPHMHLMDIITKVGVACHECLESCHTLFPVHMMDLSLVVFQFHLVREHGYYSFIFQTFLGKVKYD